MTVDIKKELEKTPNAGARQLLRLVLDKLMELDADVKEVKRASALQTRNGSTLPMVAIVLALGAFVGMVGVGTVVTLQQAAAAPASESR